ncbi:MAG TPA: phenylalanine--tRNA ligase subunit beta [Pseudobacteroides sp.]|uniref:phenylalanine--tRNA ligase subunit beta n=1 Tax=Pseudobacteroides sp. TaxID=1968840 RepID=UPI002F95BDA7
MKAPLSWLKDYVDINVPPKEYANALTLSGSKVEGIDTAGEEITKVVVGKIISIEKHPDADKLQVTKVDVGTEVIQVVTGAQNISLGDFIPVALVGATLPGDKKISKGKLRGIESCGMMCSIAELNLTKEDFPEAAENGIFILNKELPLGKDIKEILGLNEITVEFEITSNRPDCFSMVGLARESAVTLGTQFRKPEITVKEEGDDAAKYASVEIKDADLCPRYAARVVKDVKIGPSPKWLKDRLKTAGVRSINNIVDITNYVMLELGQPMHAFDLEKLQDKKIIVRRAVDGEVMQTLDEQERSLDSSMLVIADGVKPVAVAGVMGGANSEVDDNTKTILFESANFHGISVRLTGKKLGLRTEASSRFEKGLDVENVITALDRAVQLVEMLGAGTVCKGIIDCYVKKPEVRKLPLNPEKINKFLGTSIEPQYMINLFKNLEFGVDESSMTLTVPSFRPDVEREADVFEEVARFYDYNNITPTLLSGKEATQGKKTFKQKVEDSIKNTMTGCGLSEIYTYSFTSPKVWDKINLPSDSKLRKAVVITNPLGEDYSVMRTTTIPEMLDVISRNHNRRIEEARLFEVSSVYLPQSIPVTDLPVEKPVLTIGMYGNTDFYDLKGIVEELLFSLKISKYEFAPLKDFAPLHPGRTAQLLINGKAAGIIGEIHPEVADNFEAPEKSYIGIIDVEPLVENASFKASHKSLPKFPAVTRDIAMLVKDEILVKQIEDIIKQRSGKILERVKLFDVYKGKQVPEGMKSVAYSINFRAEDRTLTDEEVAKTMVKILDGLKNILGAQLRE